jgi:hypothetical protein
VLLMVDVVIATLLAVVDAAAVEATSVDETGQTVV